ncbi:MAG TPA: hypothetical protein VGM54_12935 [Chthoniobacter sp.]
MRHITASLLGTLFLAGIALAQQPATPPSTPSPSVAAPPIDVTPHHPNEIARLREEWTPPGEEPPASGSGDTRGFLAHYLSTKPFPEVWAHYATKLGMTTPSGSDPQYQPNAYTQLFPRIGPRVTDGRATLTIKNIQFPDHPERGATLTRREPSGRTITIFLASQGERTFVSVMIVPLH